LSRPESIGLSPGRKAGGKRVRDAQVSRGDAISTTLADGDASQVENDPPEGENAEVRQDGNSDDAGEPAAKKAREESGQETAPAPDESQNNADGEASDVQDPATVLANSIRGFLRRYLKNYLKYDRVAGRARKLTAGVLRAAFSRQQLQDLVAAQKRGPTALLAELWKMGTERPERRRRYVVYVVRADIRGQGRASYAEFRAKFKEFRQDDDYLVDDPQWENENWKIEVFGVGEGWNHARAYNYVYYPTMMTDGRIKFMKSSVIKSMHYAAKLTDGVAYSANVRTVKDYGYEPRKTSGLGLEAVLIALLQTCTRGVVGFNKQLGCGSQRNKSILTVRRIVIV